MMLLAALPLFAEEPTKTAREYEMEMERELEMELKMKLNAEPSAGYDSPSPAREREPQLDTAKQDTIFKYLMSGIEHLKAERYEQARKDFNYVLVIDPKNAEAQRGLKTAERGLALKKKPAAEARKPAAAKKPDGKK